MDTYILFKFLWLVQLRMPSSVSGGRVPFDMKTVTLLVKSIVGYYDFERIVIEITVVCIRSVLQRGQHAECD